MPQPQRLHKAELCEIDLDNQQTVQLLNRRISVQFNPETLKLSYSNQTNRRSGGDQRGGSTVQFTGQGSTTLSFDLWFDVTAPQPDTAMDPKNKVTPVNDIRKLTEEVIKFIQPKPVNDVRKLTEEVVKFIQPKQDKFIPPGIRFLWGTFLFDGIVDSINENLEFFSEDGRPLRASLSLSLSKQEIRFEFGNQQAPGLGSNATLSVNPLQQTRQGDSVQSVMGRKGCPEDWQSVANANDVDNPRQLAPGTPLNIQP